MAKTDGKTPLATPRQIALIAVLGVILIGVVASQWRSAETPVAAVELRRPETPRPAAAAGVASAQTSSASPATPGMRGGATAVRTATAKTAWPKFTAEEAARHDPFSIPRALETKLGDSSRKAGEVAKLKGIRKQAIIDLKTRGINAIVRDERGVAAVIGTKVVRIGDVLEGYRVIAIDNDGLVLAPPDPTKNTHEERP